MFKFNKSNGRGLATVFMSILIMLVSTMVIAAIMDNSDGSENINTVSDPTVIETTTTETTTTSKLTVTTTSITTTTVTTTIPTTSSTLTTTTTYAVTEPVVEEVQIETEPEIIYEEITEPYVEPDYNSEPVIDNSSETQTYAGSFNAKWYDNQGLGYSEGSSLYGSSGRTLISGYSVASNYFASGTVLYIKGGSHDGYYRVDDTGGMSNDVIDFYYSYRSDIPYQFTQDGVQSVEVWIVN